MLLSFRSVAPYIWLMQTEIASLLGAPLTTAAMLSLLDAKTEALTSMVSHLQLLQAHDAVFLLLPFPYCCICTSPSWKAKEELTMFDVTVRQALQDICNISLDDTMWSQASSPSSKGGLGIRQAVFLLSWGLHMRVNQIRIA